MNEHHETIKHLADAGAGALSVFALASHFAAIANPILVTVSTLLSIIWLAIRIRDWSRKGA
ncbi:MAG: hypothetical protein KGO96_12205 [Elusimicrobia bacterium]|nr:hypothetical protein [Elusimicrobiota bacterium]MDE2426659.1 hypothetical protein [Elusimicrobiota bacterium]